MGGKRADCFSGLIDMVHGEISYRAQRIRNQEKKYIGTGAVEKKEEISDENIEFEKPEKHLGAEMKFRVGQGSELEETGWEFSVYGYSSDSMQLMPPKTCEVWFQWFLIYLQERCIRSQLMYVKFGLFQKSVNVYKSWFILEVYIKVSLFSQGI